MKLKTPLFFLALLFCCHFGYGQDIPIKIIEQQWNGNLAKWQITSSLESEVENKKIHKQIAKSFYKLEEAMLLQQQKTTIFNGQGQIIVCVDSTLTGFGWLCEKEEFDYNFNDDLETKRYYRKSETSNGFRLKETIHYEYNENRQLMLSEQFLYNTHIGEGFDEGISYVYNNSGCLIEKEILSANENRWKTIYVVGEDCIVKEKIEYAYDKTLAEYLPKFKTVFTKTNFDEGLIEIDSFFEFSEWHENFHFKHKDQREFDMDGNFIRHFYYVGGGIKKDETWSYLKEEILQYREWTYSSVTDEWSLTLAFDNDLEFDFTDFLNKKTRSTWSDNTQAFSENWKYEKYCDNKVKIEHHENLSQNSTPTKTYFEYLESSRNCDGKSYDIDICPNPNRGIFQIKSDLLEGKDAKIKVINSIGQFVFEVKVHQQSYIFDLDLSFLINGNYILFIQNGDNYSSEKITIWK